MKNKKIIILLCILVLIITISFAYGRYVYNFVKEHILESKGFYFNSASMSINGSSHSLNNWDGVNSYSLTIDLNNRKNEYIHTETDISYDITFECSSNVICEISKNSGTIQTDVETDSYNITFRPASGFTFTSEDKAVIKTKATSTFPYVKSLSTEYIVGIETMGFSYSINDNAGDKYVELELNNGLTYYEVTEAFQTYSVGDHISMNTYATLSDEEKLNCKSALVRVTINPNYVRMDMNDSIYIKKATNISTTTIDGFEYTSSFSFQMEANSTKIFKFFKLDSTQNYKNNSSIVGISVDLAD